MVRVDVARRDEIIHGALARNNQFMGHDLTHNNIFDRVDGYR